MPLTLTTNKPREQPAESKPQPAKSKPQPAESKPQPAESKPGPGDTIEYTREVSLQGAAGENTKVSQKWSAAPSATTKTFEFLVPNQYSGALRVGISALFGLKEHQYSKRLMPGAPVMEIIDHGSSAMATELVVGYAPYPQALWQGGRDYVRRYTWDSWRNRLAPYFGLGVASVTNSGEGTRVRWLRSFYLGVEWEIVQSTSIAVAATWSRVDMLAKGLSVGGPVDKDTDILDSRSKLGVAIVLNLSPEFFKFAASYK
ncbi:MAG TPA: hypothetical protein VHN14_02400 [Kofleriaceae bacterium]|nr:hypothetical protein [Kofleriaceae bacterium]